MTLFSKKFFKKHKNFPKRQIKSQNRSKVGIFVAIFGTILFCMTCFVASDLISSVITHEGSIFIPSKIEIPENMLYCVSICDYETEDDAKIAAQVVQGKGGMGRVYRGGEFFVLVAGYPTLIEAQEVRDNLCQMGNNARIVNIKIPELTLGYHGKNKQEIEQILRFPRQVVLEIYNLILNYDDGNLPTGTLNASLVSLFQKSRQNEEKFSSLKLKLPGKSKKAILNCLNAISTTLNNCILSKTDTNAKTSALKCAMFEISEQNSTLFSLLNEK